MLHERVENSEGSGRLIFYMYIKKYSQNDSKIHNTAFYMRHNFSFMFQIVFKTVSLRRLGDSVG